MIRGGREAQVGQCARLLGCSCEMATRGKAGGRHIMVRGRAAGVAEWVLFGKGGEEKTF